MKSLELLRITGPLFALLPFVADAQAPSTIVGDGVFVQYINGTPPLVSYGYSMFLPANSGNAYQLIGIYPAGRNGGTYSYTATGSNTGQAIQNDTTDGVTFLLNLTFSSATQGNFNGTTISPPGYYQTGNFWAAIGTAPKSVAGMSLRCTVVDGLYPFAPSGNFTIAFPTSGNTYTVVGDGVVANSSGTYSYSIFNRSTALLQLNDSVTGATSVYVGFSTATSGAYAAEHPSTSSGFQISTFSVLDTTPPTVTISFPTAGQRCSNSVFTVSGKATDNEGIAAVYYQVSGQGWNVATTANNWADWSGNVTLLPGTNIIQAYSVDNSENTSPISKRDLYFVLQAPISIQINGSGTVSPNYNGQMLEIGKSFSVTAKAAPSFVFTNWVVSTNWIGGVMSNSPTLGFVMQSNLTLQANFVKISPPTLSLARQGTNVVLSWPTNIVGFGVESATNFLLGGWNTNYPSPVVVAGRYTITNPITRPVKLYRLVKP